MSQKSLKDFTKMEKLSLRTQDGLPHECGGVSNPGKGVKMKFGDGVTSKNQEPTVQKVRVVNLREPLSFWSTAWAVAWGIIFLSAFDDFLMGDIWYFYH